jgi:hypothetical protein
MSNTYGQQLEDSALWSDDRDAFSVSDRGFGDTFGDEPAAARPLVADPHRYGGANARRTARAVTAGGGGWFGKWGGGTASDGLATPWYQDWRLWSAVLCIVVLVAYLVYAHSADERVRQDQEKRYTLGGRSDHLDSLVASLERGHIENEADIVPPPDSVQYARRNGPGRAADAGVHGPKKRNAA